MCLLFGGVFLQKVHKDILSYYKATVQKLIDINHKNFRTAKYEHSLLLSLSQENP